MTRFLSLRYLVLVACVDCNDLRWFERQACIGDSTETLLLLEILGSGCIMTAAFFSGSAKVPRHNNRKVSTPKCHSGCHVCSYEHQSLGQDIA